MLYSGKYALFGSITRVNNFLASVLILKIFYFQVGGAVGGGTLQRREEKLRQWSVARARGTALLQPTPTSPPTRKTRAPNTASYLAPALSVLQVAKVPGPVRNVTSLQRPEPPTTQQRCAQTL